MSESGTCPSCGAKVPSDAPKGFCPRCLYGVGLEAGEPPGAAEVPSLASLGSFGDYELLAEIGHGGMGVVYQARQKSLDRMVALKLLLFGSHASPESVKRFRAEAVATAALQHPHIVAIHEVGFCEGQHFIAMDYVEGQSLSALIHGTPLPARRAAGYVQTIAEAIHYAHEHGILHRDLKPANVLIDANDQPRVMDFGLARRLEGDSELTVTGQVLGSPNYMPPEQAAGKRGTVSRRSDVYALGAILYHALTGRPPFVGEGMAETVQQVLNSEPVSPRALNHSVPADLETVCVKCLEKEPAKRYATAQMLAEELGRFLESKPIQARPVGRLAKTWRWCRRNPRLATAVGLVLLSLLLGLAGVSWQWRRAEAARVRAEANEKKAQTEAARSAQVAQFMKDMLKGVGPKVALGRDTRLLREILDNTAERTGRDLKGQPEVAAELLSTIGATYLQLFDLGKAEAMQREALRLRRSIFGETNAAVAGSLNDLARVLNIRRGAEDLRRAEAMARQALSIWEKLSGKESEDGALSLYILGSALLNQGKLAEAESAYREALAIRRKLFGNEHKDIASSLNNLGLVLHGRRRLAEAEQAIREAMVIQKKLFGAEHPDVADSLLNLGRVLQEARRVAEAEAAFREALAMRRKLIGDEHPQVANSLDYLACLLQTEGNLTEAEALYRECLAIREKKLPDDFYTFRTQARLGATLLGQKNYKAAEPLLLSGYAGMRGPEGKRAPHALSFLKEALQSLVQLYEETNRPEQAAEWKQKLAEFNKAESAKRIEAAEKKQGTQ